MVVGNLNVSSHRLGNTQCSVYQRIGMRLFILLFSFSQASFWEEEDSSWIEEETTSPYDTDRIITTAGPRNNVNGMTYIICLIISDRSFFKKTIIKTDRILLLTTARITIIPRFMNKSIDKLDSIMAALSMLLTRT